MKTKFLLITLVAGFITSANAQFSIGVVGFPQISNLTSKSIRKDPVMSNSLTFAGGGGLTFTKGLSEKTGVQLGLLISAQNQTIKSRYTINGVENTWKSGKHFDYLKVPVLFRYVEKLSKKNDVNFVVFAGPQFSYLLKYNGGMIVYIPDQYFDLPETPGGNDYYNKYTIDAVVGAGFEFPLNSYLDFTTGIKADMNLTNAQNPNATYNGYKVADLNGGTKAKNLTFALLLGINYTFKDPNDLIAPTNKFRHKHSGKGKF
jgi:hypothetical protein